MSQVKTRFGGLVLCANEFRFLPAVVGQLLKVCDRVVIARSTRAFADKRAASVVELRELPKFGSNVEIIQGYWEEGEARNRGIEFLGSNCDYVFTLDSDEIATTAVLERLKQHIARGHRAVACHLDTYWKSPRWTTWPPDNIPAAVIVRRDVRFRHMRVLDMEPNVIRERLIHHLSYVRTDDELLEKLTNWGHAEQVRNDWFNRVWKRWDQLVEEESDLAKFINFHPVRSDSFATARAVVCVELEAILQEYGVQ